MMKIFVSKNSYSIPCWIAFELWYSIFHRISYGAIHIKSYGFFVKRYPRFLSEQLPKKGFETASAPVLSGEKHLTSARKFAVQNSFHF